MIEVIHEQTPEPEVPLLLFMHEMLNSILRVGEQLMAFLASRHVMPEWENTVCVVDFPEDQRREGAREILLCHEHGGHARTYRLSNCGTDPGLGSFPSIFTGRPTSAPKWLWFYFVHFGNTKQF